MAKLHPEKYMTKNGDFVKFGKLREDLTIIPPNLSEEEIDKLS